MHTKPIDDIIQGKYKDFSCGIPALDEYLKRFAKTNHKKDLGKTFIFLKDEKVVGYYTISMASIEYTQLPENLRLGVPKYPIPVARIGRLAVDTSVQGQGLGKYLLIDALYRIWNAAQSIAAHGIVVDAKNEEAKKFYQYFGFIPYYDELLSLFLPLTVLKTLCTVGRPNEETLASIKELEEGRGTTYNSLEDLWKDREVNSREIHKQ